MHKDKGALHKVGNSPSTYLHCAHCDETLRLSYRLRPKFYLASFDPRLTGIAGAEGDAAAAYGVSYAAGMQPMLPTPHSPVAHTAALPHCLGHCTDCQGYVAVEDFSQSVPALQAQLAASALQFQSLQRVVANRQPADKNGLLTQFVNYLSAIYASMRKRYWPSELRRMALLQQQLQLLQHQCEAVQLLLHIRQWPGRQPRCLVCGSHAITAYPAYSYAESGCLAQLPQDLPHHCQTPMTANFAVIDPDGPLFGCHISTEPLYYGVDGSVMWGEIAVEDMCIEDCV